MKRVLINASNLHAGGGVQVATSFISELHEIEKSFPFIDFVVYVSSSVDLNLRSAGFDVGDLKHYRVLDVHGLEALRPRVVREFKGFDGVFTIFGPFYGLRTLPNHVVGFAQPWIIYPDNEIGRARGLRDRFMLSLKYFIQWKFFARSSRLVVELQHVKSRLVALKSYPNDRIDVVNNCVSSLYFDDSRWLPVAGFEGLDPSVIKIGFVSRDYPHKNIGFLVDVVKTLGRISSRKYRFFVTLTEAEWGVRTDEFRAEVCNVGAISVAQCPSFYRKVDAVIFPSLLECFSATPLEAMVMKKPLFASDRGFVRDCCGSNARYFNPLDAEDAARCIDDWFGSTSVEEQNRRVDDAYRYVLALPGSRQRSEAYVQIVVDQLTKQ